MLVSSSLENVNTSPFANNITNYFGTNHTLPQSEEVRCSDRILLFLILMSGLSLFSRQQKESDVNGRRILSEVRNDDESNVSERTLCCCDEEFL